MILLLFFLLGLLIGFLRGGRLIGLIRMNIRWIGLVIVSFAAERAIAWLPAAAFGALPLLLAALQLARFLPLLLFAALNVRNWRIGLAGAGVAANFIVIALNAWQMPISAEAARIPEIAGIVAQIEAGGMPEYMLMGGSGIKLAFLADIIPFKILPFIPFTYISAGDILLGLGVLLTVQQGMAEFIRGKHERGRGEGRPAEPLPDEYAPPPDAPALPGEPVWGKLSDTKPVRKQESIFMPPPEWKQESAFAPPPEKEPEPTLAPPVDMKKETAPVPPPDKRPEPKRDLAMLKTAPAAQYEPDAEPGYSPRRIPVKLSPRLETIARMAERSSSVADVGCDHGKLAAWLALAGVPDVIAMDVSAKSLSKTKRLVAELDIRQSVQTRVSDGLKKLRYGEAEIIVMAGMGGPTICGILEEGREKALAAEKLLLQPMNAVGTVRKWLVDNGFRISDERLAEEEGRIYQILAAVPGDDPYPPMSLFDLEVGRLLMECRHPLLGKLLNNKIETIGTILSEIADNATPKAQARREELIALRQRCQEVLEWLAG